MREQNTCPVCSGAHLENLHSLKLVDRYPEPEAQIQRSNSYHRNWLLFEKILKRSTDVVEIEFCFCATCGLIFFSPRPTEADLAVKYQDVSERGDTLVRERRRRVVDQRALRATHIRATLEPHWRKVTGRALDVGGADGHCLGELTSTFDCGLLDYESRDLWSGVRRLGNSLEDLGDAELFDVILCCHTLEHVPDIPPFLAGLVDHLANEGLLYVEVPLGCTGEIYATGNILTHLNFFSEGSLGFVLEQAGLRVVDAACRPVLGSQSYQSAVVAMARKHTDPPPGDYLRDGASITRKRMVRHIGPAVNRANAKLVLSHPLLYALAFLRRLLRR